MVLKFLHNLFTLNGHLANKVKGQQVYDEALALHGAKEYKKAAPLMRDAAELGNMHAMSVYGSMLLLGQGMKENGKEAEVWLKRAMELGEKNAGSVLGMGYATGKAGITRDLEKGRALLTEAAAAGDTQSARMLEMMDKKQGMFRR